MTIAHARISQTRTNALGHLSGPIVALAFSFAATVFGWGRPASSVAQGIATLILVAPAIYLAATESTHALPYILTIWCVAPEIRRLLDWSGNAYTSVTLVSVAPILVTAALAIPVSRRFGLIRGELRLALMLFFFAFLYALGIGLIKSGATGAVVDFAGWSVPLLVLPFLAIRPNDRVERIGWLKGLVALAMLVACYAWLQFIYAPEWDMNWLIASGMLTSMGRPLPMAFRAFGTLNSAGTAGFFFPFVIGAIWATRALRNSLGVAATLLLSSALAITQVRAGWVMGAAMLVTGLVARRGGSWWLQALSLTATLGIFIIVAPLLPGGEAVQQRFETFSDLGSDGSVNDRVDLTHSSIRDIPANPVGVGFGSSSADKVRGTSTMVNGIDNGYFAIVIYFGWFGAALFFGALLLLTQIAISSNRLDPSLLRGRDQNLRPLAVVALAGSVVGSLAITTYTGISATIIWLLYGMMLSRDTTTREPAAIRRLKGRMAAEAQLAYPPAPDATDTGLTEPG
jgi:hypothetical protein